MADDKGGIRWWLRLFLDPKSKKDVERQTQDALRKGTDARRPKKNLSAIDKGMQKLTKTAKVLGATLLAAFGARAIINRIKGAVNSFSSFDTKLQRSIAIMGDVDDVMRNKMAKTAREVAQEFNIAADIVAESFFFLASAGLNAEQSLAALPTVANFAKAGAFDMADATDLLTDAQSALGLTVADTAENMRNMTRISDILVKSNTLANATVREFSEALTNEAGATLKVFNRDLEEGAAVLAAYADQGTKGNKAGSMFSRAIRLMAQAVANNRSEMEKLNIEMVDANGNFLPFADIIESLTAALDGMGDTQRTVALESIGFKARMQGAILPLLGTSAAIREYEAELRNAAGTTQSVTDKQMKAFGERWGKIEKQLKDNALTFAEQLLPALGDFGDWIEDNQANLKSITRFLGDTVSLVLRLSDAILKGLLAGGVVYVFNQLRWAILGARTATVAFSTSIKGLFAAIGPVGWAILGVTALVEIMQALGREAKETAARVVEAEKAFAQLVRTAEDAELQTELAELNVERLRLKAEIADLRAQEEEAQGEGGQYGVEAARIMAERIGLEKELERVRARGLKVISELAHRQKAAAQAERERLSPHKEEVETAEERNARLTDEIDLLNEANDLKILGLDHIERALDIEGELATLLADGNLTLAQRVELLKMMVDLKPVTDVLPEPMIAPRIETEPFAEPPGKMTSIFSDGAREQQEAAILRMMDNWDRLGAAGENVAYGVAGAWQEAFAILGEEGANVGDFFETLGAQMGGAMLGGIAEYAAGKAAQNVAWAMEKIGMGLGFASMGNLPGAALSEASAGQHLAAAAAWSALAGGAGAAQSAVAGGGRGGLSGGVPSGARDIGGRLADGQQGETHIHLWGEFDALNPKVQQKVHTAYELGKQSAGNNTKLHMHRGRP